MLTSSDRGYFWLPSSPNMQPSGTEESGEARAGKEVRHDRRSEAEGSDRNTKRKRGDMQVDAPEGAADAVEEAAAGPSSAAEEAEGGPAAAGEMIREEVLVEEGCSTPPGVSTMEAALGGVWQAVFV